MTGGSADSRVQAGSGSADDALDLRVASVRGGYISVGIQAARVLVSLTSTVVLARLLMPADFGLLAMAGAIIALLAVFRDLGLSTATIQSPELTMDQVSTLFWLNAALGLALSVALVAAAPFIARVYGEPRLTAVLVALGAGFVVDGLGVQHTALLKRNFRLGALAGIELPSLLVGLLASIAGALSGWGYWALVVGLLSSKLVTLPGLWWATPWRPGRPRFGASTWPLLRFGAQLLGFEVANQLMRKFDDVLIGWRYGAQPLGLYSRAYSLLLVPLVQLNGPLSAVAIPALSRLQNDPERFSSYYLKTISLLAMAGMPLCALMLVSSRDVVICLLGANWTGAVSIFQILAISAPSQLLCNSTGWLFVSRGRTAEMFVWGLLSSAIIVLSFVLGLPWGPVGVAMGYATAICFLTVPCIWYATTGTRIRYRGIVDAAGMPLLCSIAGGLLCRYAQQWLPSLEAVRLALSALLLSVSYAALMWCLPSSRRRYALLLRELWPPATPGNSRFRLFGGRSRG